MIKGFNNSELSIAVEAFIRHKLDEKNAKLREWQANTVSGNPVMGNGIRRKAGEIQGMEEVLKFMIQNRK
jgi:hypothetical protein